MKTETPKSYDELQREAAQSWKRNVSAHASRMRSMEEQIAQSPDVVNAPMAGSIWDNDQVLCPACQTHTYEMRRWACVNGQKYRTEVRCVQCEAINTWDFELNTWLS